VPCGGELAGEPVGRKCTMAGAYSRVSINVTLKRQNFTPFFVILALINVNG
jgi:hypothetical protein